MVIAGVFAALALWLGYALGYRRGAQCERRAWESTQEVTLRPDTRTSGGPARTRVFYTNPHAGAFVWSSPGLAVVNQPDPRIYRQYEHPLP